VTDYLTPLCDFAARIRFEDLPPAVVSRARQVVADTLAVIAAGAREPEIRALAEQLAGGDGPASLLGDGRRTGALPAALINGAAGTFLELDEGNQFGRGHPAIHVLPAVLAVCEEKRLSGRELILALALGYEVGTRIGIAAKIRMSMHPHGTWGTTGAAAAVAKLCGYRAEGFREIINLSSCLALATSRKTMLEGATVRNVYSGVSNHMGLLAHHLVAAGFTGEADGLRTVYGAVISESFDPAAMTAELGERWEIARNYFKQHACCRYNHAALDALLAVMARAPGGRLSPGAVAGVEVETYSLAAQLCDRGPRNMLAAKFSIPFAVATTLVHGGTGVASFAPEAVGRPEVQALARRVRVVEDPALTAMMPARRPARVRLTLTDGTVLAAEALVNKGDAEDPYAPDDLRRKYVDLATPAWGEAAASAVFEAVGELETLSDVNRITELIREMRR
jgi:2-methylcitrate dehydratase PrpD